MKSISHDECMQIYRYENVSIFFFSFLYLHVSVCMLCVSVYAFMWNTMNSHFCSRCYFFIFIIDGKRQQHIQNREEGKTSKKMNRTKLVWCRANLWRDSTRSEWKRARETKHNEKKIKVKHLHGYCCLCFSLHHRQRSTNSGNSNNT